MLTPCGLRVQANQAIRGMRPAPLPTHRRAPPEKPSGPHQRRSPVPVFNRVDRKAKQRPAESFGQGKHGNISFLLTQESGTDLREVACSFRREPSAIRFNRVKSQACGLWDCTHGVGILFAKKLHILCILLWPTLKKDIISRNKC